MVALSATTARTRGLTARLLRTLRAGSGVGRAPIAAGVVLTTVITASLSGAGGTTALWTGSVSAEAPPSLTAGAITASLAGFSDLSTTYTAGALDRTRPVTLGNSGTVAARYTASVTLAQESSSALASATTVTVWPVAAADSCTATAEPTNALTGTWTAVPQLTGTLPAGGSTVYCFRTRIPSTALASAASVSSSLRLDLAVPDTGWTSTAGSHPAIQGVGVDPATLSDYIDAVRARDALHYWRLGEPAGSRILYDWVGTADAYAGSGLNRGLTGALVGDPNTATGFSGDSNGTAGTRVLEAPRNSFAIEAWVKTSTTTGGTIVGFGDASTGTSTKHDRALYMDSAGRIVFAVNPGTPSVLTSSSTYRDDVWHHVVGQLGPNGQELYIDGARVASSGTTTAGTYSGYWRIGGDSALAGDSWFDGTIDEVAVYSAPLAANTIANHRNLSGRGAFPVVAADPYGSAVYTDAPALFWRLNDASSSSTAADASGNTHTGNYSGNVVKPVAGAVAGTRNAAASFEGGNGLIASSQSLAAPSVYSTELWFKTNSTTGGKLIGFGNAASGSSTIYDRHIYLQNDGKLNFGVWTDGPQVITSSKHYNDDRWHHVVATQSSAGMVLYVDGQPVANGPVSSAGAGTGYWRVGGDNLGAWPNAPATSHVTAAIDEVAVYSAALTPSQVKRHYSVATGTPAASFTAAMNGMVMSVDASASSDYDGTLSSYSWNWGDGTPSGTGSTAVHHYAAPGNYTVTLTVTDNSARTDNWTRQVTATDNIAPGTPVAPSVTSNTGTTVGLSWPAATDNVGVTGYDIFRDGVHVTTVSGTIWTDTGRSLNTTYTYTVRARDGAGNASALSPGTSVTTPLLDSNAWYQLRVQTNGKCMTAAGITSGTSLYQANCSSPASAGQLFQFQPVSGGFYSVSVKAAPTLVWSTTSSSNASKVVASTSSNLPGQQWRPSVQGDGSHRFEVLSPAGMCMDPGNVSPGSSDPMIIQACGGVRLSHQAFNLLAQ